jgi:hypothetical protein
MGAPVGYGTLMRGRRGITHMCCGFQRDAIDGCITTVYYSIYYIVMATMNVKYLLTRRNPCFPRLSALLLKPLQCC